jgi:NAD-dependent oxidoreductase involved in siderophore biosynthesis
MQVRRLKLKHLKNSTAVDLICSLLDFIILAMGATELCRN